MDKISCIIPVFNEETRIATVLDAALEARRRVPFEIIVVDDGSRDGTADILRKYKDIRIITNKENKGKSYAIAMGLEASTGGHIFLLDADLIGLTADNIRALIAPVQNASAHVALSVRKNSLLVMRMINLDCLTGERVFSRSLVAPYINEIKKLPNFGFEVFLNKLIIKNKCPVTTIYWNNVSNDLKLRKRGLYPGLKAEREMFRDILKTVSTKDFVRQNIALKRLSV